MQRSWTSPFGLILEQTVRLGQHDLTEKEVHDIWIKKRFNAFAEVIGVELEISDIGENGMVSVRALKPVSLFGLTIMMVGMSSKDQKGKN